MSPIIKVLYEAQIAILPAAVREIYEFRLPLHRAETQLSQAAISQNVSGHESCPCGSGEKFKADYSH